jgi:hypothetical protein
LENLARRLFGPEAFAKQSSGKAASPITIKKVWHRRCPRAEYSNRVKMGFLPTSLHSDSLQRLVPSWFRPQNTTNVRFLVYGILLGFSFSLTATSFVLYYREKRQRDIVSRFKPRPIELRSDEIAHGVTGVIGGPT